MPGFLGNSRLAALVAVGWLALLVAFIVGSTRGDPVAGRRFGRLAILAVAIAAFALLVLAAGLLLHSCDTIVGHFVRESQFVRTASPDGEWLAVGTHRDQGALGGDSAVSLQRDLGGVVRLRRVVYRGGDFEPAVRWLDSRTISVGRHVVDIYRDPKLDE